MTTVNPIIELPSDASPEWFTGVFAASGREHQVVGVTSEPIGTGQSGHNERFFLTYDGDPGPATVVAKLPAQNDLSRAAGARGGYLTETRFYQHLAADLSIRTPGCFHASVTDDSNSFTLLLEDMAPAEQGDQIAGCSVDEVVSAIVGVAGLHGPRWNDATLYDYPWFPDPDDPERMSFAVEVVKMLVPGFIARYETQLTDQHREVVTRFGDGIESWLTRSGPGFGLVHQDYRPDNLMFAPGLNAPTTAVDWQTVSVGLVLNDVAYLLGNALDPQARRSEERAIVEQYRQEMLGYGVTDLTAESCFDAYRSATFHGPFITILGSMMVEQTDRGDEMFMVMIDRSVQQILDLDALEFLS